MADEESTPLDVEEEPQDDVTDLKAGKPTIQCPVTVVYCGVCSLPVEYCEYHPTYDKCREWLKSNFPDMFEKLTLSDGKCKELEEDTKKRQKRGGKGVVKTKKKAEPQVITIARVTRNKKKFVTIIRGLATHEIDLKKASKKFANHFSCGSAVTAENDIVIQGDVTDDVIDMIVDKFKIDPKDIEDVGDQKR